MRVTHRVSFQIGNQFEQHTAEFSLETEDVHNKAFDSLNLLEKMLVFQTLLLKESLLFQLADSYIDEVTEKKRWERVISGLAPNVKEAVKSVLVEKEHV